MASSTMAICALFYIDYRFLPTITGFETVLFVLANTECLSAKGLDSAFQL
ncbi:hypothetical protein JK628_05465 [Shewanella sp. KX20019]|nr:hypothetical protein [Shewanella sp. KX20019]QQX81315.1 hypothetical protein JK628_05465 [Shewanella sp. KX20019]